MKAGLPPSRPNFGVLSDEFYSAIGVVVVRWSLLEEAANLAIAGLLKSSFGEMLPVLVNLHGQTRFNTLLALSQQSLNVEVHENLVSLMKPVDTLISDRNKVVHGAWRSTDDPTVCVLLTSTARGKLRLKGNPVHLNALITLGNSIGLVKDSLIVFLDRLGIDHR